MTNREYKDHLGQVYPTFTAMAAAWGHPRVLVASRMKSGWSLERALTEPACHPVTAPDGKRYRSKRAMCEAMDVDYKTYLRRLSRGWNEEEALLPRRSRHAVTAPDGSKHRSAKAMCDALGANYGTYLYRVKHGVSMKDALTKDGVRAVTGPDGVRYPTTAAMCKAYGVGYSAYYKRRREGLSLAEALYAPGRLKPDGAKKSPDPLNKGEKL